MSSIYDKYNENLKQLEYNKQKLVEFFQIIAQFANTTYAERIEIMTKLWGTIDECPKTFYYGDACSITISKKDNQYKFKFDCKSVYLNELFNLYPDFANEISKHLDAALKKDMPELFNEENHAQNELDLGYLNVYRNININMNNSTERHD